MLGTEQKKTRPETKIGFVFLEYLEYNFKAPLQFFYEKNGMKQKNYLKVHPEHFKSDLP